MIHSSLLYLINQWNPEKVFYMNSIPREALFWQCSYQKKKKNSTICAILLSNALLSSSAVEGFGVVVVFGFETAFFAAVDVVPRTVSLHKDNEFLKRIRKPRVVDVLPAGDIPAFRTTFGNEHGASSKVELVNVIHFFHYCKSP